MDLATASWKAISTLSRRTPVVFPIAAVEQHGHHLPLYTDSFLLGEILRRVRERLAGQVLFAPLQWLGNSDHHLDFPGTLSASPRVYLDLLAGLAENFVRHGFQRIVFINGHGGNDVPGRQVVFELRQRHRDRDDLLFLLGTYWSLAGPLTSRGAGPLKQEEMGHACEWETSMMLRLAPDLVGDCKSSAPVEPGNPFLPGSRGWVTRERSGPGHIGWPHLASAEKGEELFSHFAAGVAGFLERVRDWDGVSWDG
jgi:creatinine amidohydrolase